MVLHLPPDAKSHLPGILDRAGPLPAVHVVDDAPIRPGRIYVAPPNRHLMLEGDRMRLSIGPRINSLRPSIDVLFRSAARSFGPRVIGVVLSGTLDDGTLGLDAIKQRGGVVVIQDPEEALFPGMPRSAIARVTPDYVMPVAQIPALLARLTVGLHSGEVDGGQERRRGARHAHRAPASTTPHHLGGRSARTAHQGCPARTATDRSGS